jgi:hypothetical protein
MEKEVDVDVDEAGHEGGVAEVDDFSSGRMFDGGARGSDAIAFDEDLAWGDDLAGFDIEEAGGVEDDGRSGDDGRRFLSQGSGCAGERAEAKQVVQSHRIPLKNAPQNNRGD